ncbi:hypothetical protein XBO1_2490001 [Xenorhabdus bovienii str. oregonense]|uniref:Uncharacterized protein n=1 Tax=Xenorhabdus bovienii str. oregonense TaxID=1398202 RepID=A0A077NXG0_XENBV|nr:hypothetical protein [Xenorhabdus bovienii]MDE9570517.1 hypothetical protein [Xenorhabdus bovienii]CDH06857.1 hypothetical protein XBO1_2490001 [Xenorhabdus bovienii str. oregonense]
MNGAIEITRREAMKYALADDSISNEKLAEEVADGISFHLEANGLRDSHITVTITHD